MDKRVIRINNRYWRMSASRESLLIPLSAAYQHGWGCPVNLSIYRRHVWRIATENRIIP